MAIDIDQSHYSTGTATVSGVTVTGFGTTFTVLRKGDQWGTHKGFGVRIADITDDTHLTLAYNVPGLQQTAAPFEVQRTPYDIGYLQAIEDILRLMGDGALPSMAGVDGTGGDKLIKLIGPKTAVAFDGKRVINIAALTGAGVIEFDALGNASMVPKADLVTGVYADGKANTIAERNTKFGAQAAGFTVLVANIGDGRSAIYFKNTATLNDWSAAAPLTGPVGPTPTITVGTTTTVAPDRPATVSPVAIPGGVRLDFEIPRGPTGDINGVTSFWNMRLGSDTTAAAARAGLGTFGAVRIKRFTASGTYTPDPNLLFAEITCQAAGAAGGGTTGSAGNSKTSGGGGAGSRSIKIASKADIGASKPVSVGALGAGVWGEFAGGDGGDTSVGTLCIAKGGKGGKPSGAALIADGGLGGAVGTGDVTGTGQTGAKGNAAGLGTTVVLAPGGQGAGSAFGGGGTGGGPFNNAQDGNPATGYGAGGGGAAAHNFAGNAAGGSGSSGIVIIIEFCTE